MGKRSGYYLGKVHKRDTWQRRTKAQVNRVTKDLVAIDMAMSSLLRTF